MRNQKFEKRRKIVIPKSEFLKLEKGMQLQFRLLPVKTKIKDVEYVEIEALPSGDFYLTSVYSFKELYDYAIKMGVDFNTKEFFFHVIGKEGDSQRWNIEFYEIL